MQVCSSDSIKFNLRFNLKFNQNLGTNWFNSGSGIYSQGEVLSSFYNPTATSQSKLLISQVPKLSPNLQPEFKLKTIDSVFGEAPSLLENQFEIRQAISPNISIFQAIPGSFGEISASYGAVHCHASYRISTSSPSDSIETLALIAYEGSVMLLRGVRTCAIVKCDSVDTCSQYAMTSRTIFSHFSLDGDIPETDHRLMMVASNQCQLMSSSKYTVSRDEIRSEDDLEEIVLNVAIFGILWNDEQTMTKIILYST